VSELSMVGRRVVNLEKSKAEQMVARMAGKMDVE
jgi:hypothetical protein